MKNIILADDRSHLIIGEGVLYFTASVPFFIYDPLVVVLRVADNPNIRVRLH